MPKGLKFILPTFSSLKVSLDVFSKLSTVNRDGVEWFYISKDEVSQKFYLSPLIS